MTTDTPFTPGLERVRDRYIAHSQITSSAIGGPQEYGEAFDRFLAKEKADAVREYQRQRAVEELLSLPEDDEWPATLTEDQLRLKIRHAIGYAPVALSIRDHPEIRSEYRTAEDADGLVDRISAALLPYVLQANDERSEA